MVLQNLHLALPRRSLLNSTLGDIPKRQRVVSCFLVNTERQFCQHHLSTTKCTVRLPSRNIFDHSTKMADNEADPELVALLRQHLGLEEPSKDAPADTRVLQSAEFVYNNSIDVAIDMRGTKAAAELIYQQMQQRSYSTKTWSEHKLHPKAKDESTVNFIFTMDLLNFCFWSEKGPEERFAVEHRGQRWTGYWSLVAALQRALDEGRL